MKKKLPFRAWYYFRIGYGQYFVFLLGLGNMFTLTYYLAISDNPALETIFPSFTVYVIISSSIGIPVLGIIGYIHMKKSPAYSSEQDIAMESQPYHYKLPPGIWSEIYAPFFLSLLILERKSITGEKISTEDIDRLNKLEKNLELLKEGQSLPKPKKFFQIN